MEIRSNIRFAQKDDIQGIIELCRLHADYEKSEYDVKGKAEKLLESLFSEKPKLYCLVADNGDELIGFATYMLQYATWEAKEYVYMDCLFIKEFARSLGIGKKLVRQIEKEGKKMDCHLVQWQTPDFNTRAIKFYKRLGATSKRKERFFLTI